MLPQLNKKYRSFFLIALFSLLFSLTVEVVQMGLKVGIFDVDDIFLNTMGGILGYVFYAILSFLGRIFRPSK
jgi:glycopeptide antibiotics resistance protein